MESDLLEISGEDDDSLLLQHHKSPSGDVSAFSASYFSCSPLNFPGSNPPGPDEKAINPSHLSNVDKENVNNNVNKSELPKLSLDPQQMKRKKKVGGYNLRKSLAWNHAFFTEEGVLNSTELSLISGDFGKWSGGTLSVIEEERRESLSGDSIDLRALENNLFKEQPLNNSAKSEEKKIGGCLPQKSSGSAPRSAVRQNVLSVHDVNRSGSKRSGCPRPVMSSAPANMSTTKAATKEPEFSKLPAPKPDSSVLSSTSKSAPNINKPKRNQSAQAAVAHRSFGLTGSKKSIRSTQNDAKAGLSSRSQITKSSAQQVKRNARSSALASPSSTCLQHPFIIKADNVLKVKQDPIVAAGDRSINHEPHPNKSDSIPQSGSHSGGNTQYAQPLAAKPSGLRMPSPSLGFFSQSKSNASQNLQKSTQPSKKPKSNIPNLRKLGVLNSICEIPTSSMKVPVVSNRVAAITNQRISSLESSVPSRVNSLCQDIGPTLQMPRVEAKVLCNSDNHKSMNNHQQLCTIEDDIKLHENVGLQGTDIRGSSANDDQISSMHGSDELQSKQAEQAKPCTINNDQMINKTERPQIYDGTMLKEGETSEGFHSYNGAQSNGICQKLRDCSASELESSNGLSHYRNRIQGTDDVGEAAAFDLKSHVGSTQIHSFEGDLSFENGSSLLNASEADDPHLLVDDVKEKRVEQPALPEADFVVERVFQDNNGSQSTDCLLREENFSSEKIIAESNLQSAKYVGAILSDTSQNELGNSGAPSSVPSALQNGGHEMADVVQRQYVENAVSVSTDAQHNHDIERLSEATSEGLERIAEDQLSVAINACDIGVTGDRQSTGELNGNEIDKFHPVSQTSPVERFKGYSEMDEIIDLKGVEGNQHNLSAKCNSDTFELEEQIDCCNVDMSVMFTHSSLNKQYDIEKSIAQAELIHSSEAHKSSQVNLMQETHHGVLSVDGKAFQESHSFDSDNHAGVSSKDKSSVRQVVEGPSDLSQIECPDEQNEGCGLEANEMTTRSFKEDVHRQSSDNSSPHLFSLPKNNNFAMVVEDLNECSELQDAVSVEEILSDKLRSSVNEEVSSSLKIKLPDDIHDRHNDMIFRPDNEQSGQATSLNFVLSSLSEDQISGAGSTCNSQALGEKNENDKKQDAAAVKPPSNAIPFSDEWLAAFEAAGEEVLTMKSGAVQHSPEDKSLPEPSPWSPVRRKNNQGIGPFDCTKFTNIDIPPGSDF